MSDIFIVLTTHFVTERASRIIVQLGGIQDILTAMRHARYHATLNAVCCMALWSLTVDSEFDAHDFFVVIFFYMLLLLTHLS